MQDEFRKGHSDDGVDIVRDLTPADLEMLQELTARRERAQLNLSDRISRSVSLIGDSVITFLAISQRKKKRVKIYRPPGLTLDQFAQAIFSRKTYRNTFKPTIDDHRIEHAEALAAGDLKLARRIAIRCNAYMVVSMIAKIPSILISLCFRLVGI